MRSLVLRIAGTALLLAALVWLFDVGAALGVLRNMRPSAVLGIVLLSIVSWSIGILKWKLLLGDVSTAKLARFYFIGLLYSMVLPGQLAGEAVKTVRLANTGAGIGRVGASVLIDRLTGMIGLGIVSGGGLLLTQADSSLLRLLGALVFAATLVFAVVVFAIRAPFVLRPALRLMFALNARGGWLRRAGGAYRRFLGAWRAHARDHRLMAISVLVGVLFQLSNVVIVWVTAWGLQIPLALSDAAWSTGVVLIVTLVPVSFGGLGVRELSFVAALGLIGVPAAQALSLSIASTLIAMLSALVGLIVETGWPGSAGRAAVPKGRVSHA